MSADVISQSHAEAMSEQVIAALTGAGIEAGSDFVVTRYFGGGIIHVSGALAEGAGEALRVQFDSLRECIGFDNLATETQEGGLDNSGLLLHKLRRPLFIGDMPTEEADMAATLLSRVVEDLRPVVAEGDEPFAVQSNHYLGFVGVTEGIARSVGVAEQDFVDPKKREAAVRAAVESPKEFYRMPHARWLLRDGRYEVRDNGDVWGYGLYVPAIGNWHQDAIKGRAVLVHDGGSGTLHTDKAAAASELGSKRSRHLSGEYQQGDVNIATEPGDVTIMNGHRHPHMASSLSFDDHGNISGHSLGRRSVVFGEYLTV